jgi:hypothetical protein
MSLLPPSTNTDYRGSLIAPWALGLLALLTIVPGCIHAFLPDGGAVAIAGLDISANPDLVIGGVQLVAMVLLWMSLRSE